jgi:hypothetical protein
MHEIPAGVAHFGRILPVFPGRGPETSAVNCDYADKWIKQINRRLATSDRHLRG